MNGIINAVDVDIDELIPGNQLRNDTPPHEFVEVIVQLLPAVIPLITEVFRLAVKRKKLERVEVDYRNKKIVIEGDMSYDQVQGLIHSTFGVSESDLRRV